MSAAWVRLLCAWLALQPATAAAAEEAHHGPSWFLLALQVINVVVLAVILVRFTRRPLARFLQERSRSVARQIEEARARLEEARAELSTAKSRLERFERESAEIMASAEQQARADAERATERAQHTAERVREEARSVAEQEIERARRELRAEAAELAIDLAEGLLSRNLSAEDDRRLVAEFARRVEERA